MNTYLPLVSFISQEQFALWQPEELSAFVVLVVMYFIVAHGKMCWINPISKNIFFIGLIWKIESLWTQSIWDEVIRMGVIWYYYCPGKRGKFESQPRCALEMVRWTDNTCEDRELKPCICKWIEARMEGKPQNYRKRSERISFIGGRTILFFCVPWFWVIINVYSISQSACDIWLGHSQKMNNNLSYGETLINKRNVSVYFF